MISNKVIVAFIRQWFIGSIMIVSLFLTFFLAPEPLKYFIDVAIIFISIILMFKYANTKRMI